MSKNLKIWIMVAVTLLVAGGAAVATVIATRAKSSLDTKKEAPPLEFSARDIVQLAARRLTTDVTLTGSIMAVTQATVRSKLSAEVVRVFVREGDRVTAGQVLAEFDKAQLRQQAAERVATLESAKAQLVQNEKTRQANAQLVKQNFISQNAFDTTDSSFRAQAAAVDVAQAQLAQTELQLADAVVRAPISGFVAKRYVQPGEKLAFDAPMLAIVDLTQLEVAAQAPVADVAKAAPGAAVEIEVEGLTDHVYKGRIDRVNPSTEPGTRMITVYAAIANNDAKLRAGMFAKMRLPIGGEKDVPSLPLAAIQAEGDKPIVWVIAGDKLARRAITIGRRDERAQLVEITSGLDPSEQVIASKFDNLRDGLTARIVSGNPRASTMALGAGGEARRSSD